MCAAKDRPPRDAAASCRPVTFAAPARINSNLRQESQIRPFIFNRLRTLLPEQKLQPAHFQLLTHSLMHAKNVTAAFPITSTLFLRSFAPERKSTPLVSCACALFWRNGGYLQNLVNILYYLDSLLSSGVGCSCEQECGPYLQPKQVGLQSTQREGKLAP